MEMWGNVHTVGFRLVTTPSSLWPFSVQARYDPFQGPHDMDLPSSQSARSIEPRPASWQCI
jgi:hypothetical protein